MTARAAMPIPLVLARLAELPDGEPVARDVELPAGARRLILLRAGADVHAYLNSCPHRGVRLDWTPGRLLTTDGHHLQCAMHGALFEPTTGRCIAGPCTGARLNRLAVGIRGNEVVVAEGASVPESALAR
jgi:nitrite reductase/ring-hydroxylating ferredoxin subunit